MNDHDHGGSERRAEEPRSFDLPKAVDLDDEQAVEALADRLDTTAEEIRAAGSVVGSNTTAIEIYLTGPAS